MSYITLKCKNCGANMSLNTESHSATCIHCGSTFLISEILDEKDVAFMSKFSSKELEEKMLASDELKHGETYLCQCEFEKAENSFKRAIELDDSNFRAYLGVVKAKTKNFNKLPDNDDYLQYAHYALSLASGDDLVFVKSELSKIELLQHEDRRLRRIFSANKKKEEKYRKHRKEVSKVCSLIAVFIILMFGVFIFACAISSGYIFGSMDKTLSINVDSYESLTNVFSNNKYLDYDIVLTDDIDCGGNTLIPFGSQTNAFTGSLNGNNHKISNAVIKAQNENHVGLFGYAVLADIKNVVLDKISLSVTSTPETATASSYGLLVGKAEATTISNVEIKNTCDVSVVRDISYPSAIGGAVGSLTNSSFVSNVSCHPNISVRLTQIIMPATSYVGGIIGTTQNSVIQKTCSNSAIYSVVSNTSYSNSSSYASGIIGSILNPTSKDILNVNHNYFSGLVSLSASSIVDARLSAIAHSSLNATKMLNNACLYTSTNFILKSTYLSYLKLEDFAMNEYFVNFCTSNDTYLARLAIPFEGWTASNTFEPSLA